MTAAIRLDQRYELRSIEVGDLRIARYQRPADDRRVARMAEGFDLRLVGALVVSFRDGSYWVVTGQHRMLAARRIGVRTLPAIVYFDLSYQEEAAMFERNATTTIAVAPYNLHRTRLEAGDPAAQAIERIIRAAGHVGFTQGGSRGLSSVRTCYRLNERRVLEPVLAAVRVAWERDGRYEPGALKGGVLRAVGDFLLNRPEADRERLADVLGKHRPGDLQYLHPVGGARVWVTILDWYNQGLAGRARLDPVNK